MDNEEVDDPVTKKNKKGLRLVTPPALTGSALAAVRRSMARSRPTVAYPARALTPRRVGSVGGFPTT
jgi:hypothetical protein